METEKINIWYLLVDSAGQPYKRTSGTSLDVKPTDNIDKFRRLVKELNPNNLLSFDAAELKVYKNRHEFENARENSLDEELPIAGLGSCKKEALMVLVPEPARVSIDSIIDSYLANMTVKLDNLWSDTRCLTLDLGNRITKFDFDDENNVKIMLAVSGGGKTRTLLELLYKNFGMYFVANVKSGILGSRDVQKCIEISRMKPQNVHRFINALVHVRYQIMKWFIDNSKTPEEWLYAQLYPLAVFGRDIFLECYEQVIAHDFIVMEKCFENYPIIVDEAQALLSVDNSAYWYGFQNTRPFLSPVVLYMKPWAKQFIISGTGINFEALEDLLSSATLKDLPYDYVNINGFPFLDERKVYEYSTMVIDRRLQIMHRKSTPIYDRIAKYISQNVLCHGRPRLTASVLDKFFSRLEKCGPTNSFSYAVEHLEKFVYGLGPIKIVRFIGEEKNWQNKIIGEELFHQVVTRMFINTLVTGFDSIAYLASENGKSKIAEMVSRGIGFATIDENSSICRITLQEPAVREYLSVCLDFEKYLHGLMRRIVDSPRNTHVGDWFEYLVAAALIRKFGDPSKPIKKSVVSLGTYLNVIGECNSFVKPDDMCGPDIVFKNGKTVWIVQVRCVKRFYRAYRLNSAETLDPRYFYTVRNPKSKYYGQVLKGYQHKYDELIEALQEYKICKVVVACTRVKIPTEEHPDIIWINQNSPAGKDFFEPINGDPMFVWKVLEDQCNSSDGFEKPNADDPDDIE